MILDRYLVRQFLPIFAVAISMFVMLMSLIDLFANLVRYLNYEVPVKEILRVSLYYLPKSLSYALPISLLFAAAYTLGDLYARNELTSIFSSGIPFYRFSLSLVLIGLCASVFSFYFDDLVVIPTLRVKNDLSRLYLHQQRTENNSDIVIKARNGELIYSIDYFDSTSDVLNGISIIEQNSKGEFISLVRAPQAAWTGEYWLLTNPIIYEWDSGFLKSRPLEETDVYRELPDTFRRNAVNVEELHVRDARLLVRDLKTAGLPFIIALANYYHRFSFAFTSFVVMILSISMGGRFRKNILLMSLLASLCVAVFFYVMEMITMMMARLGYIPPIVGAWFPVGIFILIGALLLRTAKT
ncbi:membrane protein [Spirochaetia bacterium]|nr:membrane protein [Spirochaetia bacterium]GHV90279.1 membrane protein [Spirochaetia bacterium]GHV90282.1 membrane protein [Spirochaetia bacterium]